MTDDDDEGPFDTGEFEVRDDADGIPLPIEHEDFEVDGDEVVEDLEASLESEDDSMPGLEAGLDPELVSELRELTKGTGTRHEATIRAVESDTGTVGTSMSGTRTPEYETYDVDVQHEQANALLKHIYSKINETENEYGLMPDLLVLGLPQYHILEPWAQAEHGHGIEDVLPTRLVIVPGPMIHPVVPNRVLYTEYLREEHDG